MPVGLNGLVIIPLAVFDGNHHGVVASPNRIRFCQKIGTQDFFSDFCYHDCTMVTLNAHFDGKVIVPDEPLALEPNQKLRISVEPIQPSHIKPRTDWHSLIGIANQGPINPNPRFPDNDSLWEGTTGNYLENGPNKPSMKKPAP